MSAELYNTIHCLTHEEACKALLYSLALLLRLQKVDTPLANSQQAFLSGFRSPVRRLHVQQPLWLHVYPPSYRLLLSAHWQRQHLRLFSNKIPSRTKGKSISSKFNILEVNKHAPFSCYHFEKRTRPVDLLYITSSIAGDNLHQNMYRLEMSKQIYSHWNPRFRVSRCRVHYFCQEFSHPL